MTTKYEIGCYGDGTYGHQHTRERCAETMEDVLTTAEDWSVQKAIIAELRTEGCDDFCEEDLACDWLNIHAEVEGASWGWQDGDFGLWSVEDDT